MSRLRISVCICAFIALCGCSSDDSSPTGPAPEPWEGWVQFKFSNWQSEGSVDDDTPYLEIAFDGQKRTYTYAEVTAIRLGDVQLKKDDISNWPVCASVVIIDESLLSVSIVLYAFRYPDPDVPRVELVDHVYSDVASGLGSSVEVCIAVEEDPPQ